MIAHGSVHQKFEYTAQVFVSLFHCVQSLRWKDSQARGELLAGAGIMQECLPSQIWQLMLTLNRHFCVACDLVFYTVW